MLNHKVSILIPFKNTAKYLNDCLDSITNQSYENWEAIIVDDCSTDHSYKVVQSYAKLDTRIKLLSNQGQGIIDALRTAYDNSTGDYITRMDSDDIMQKSKIECMANDLSQNGKGFIALGLVEYFCETGIKEGYKIYEQWLNKLISTATNFNEIYKECVIPSPCWMVHRSDFEKANGFNSNTYPEDYDLAFRFFKIGLKCLPSSKVLHFWRDYPIRTSRTSPNYAENNFLNLKLDYFLKLSYKAQKIIVLWGAGKKGKKIAKLLIKTEILFIWICNNPEKIGKKIYNQQVKSWKILSNISNSQSIITVANKNAQDKIKAIFKAQNKQAMIDYFFFC